MLTLCGKARFDTEIKRSRFVTQATRVDGPEQAAEFLESAADPDATHNCWAWKISPLYRFQDDGEPAGTAGKPILSAIEGKLLDHVMVVVTRYFGGTKLGAGGLVRAYSGSAARCLDAADVVEVPAAVECSIAAGYGWTGQLYAVMDAVGASKLGEGFDGNGIVITARVDEQRYADLLRALRDATRGEVRIRKLD
jgi:uncharacterized YigZ family protein